jgi:TRAP-type C4-dicarboxylate transport system permease small subunit
VDTYPEKWKGATKAMEGQTNRAATRSAPADGFARFVSGLSKVIDPIARYGGAIGAGILAFMMFLTVIDVLGRFLGGFEIVRDYLSFMGPVSGSMEMTELALGILVTFGLGYCALHKGHIRVDLLLQYTSRKANLWFDIFTYAISFIFFIGVVWQSWVTGFSIHESQLSTAVLSIPIYPFPFVMMLGLAILALVLIRDFLQSIEEVRR